MIPDINTATHSPSSEVGLSETGLIALSDEELDVVAGGRHHHRHHGHGSAIAHSSHDFFERSLSISVQKTTDAHGTTTTSFSIELTEIMSHLEQT